MHENGTLIMDKMKNTFSSTSYKTLENGLRQRNVILIWDINSCVGIKVIDVVQTFGEARLKHKIEKKIN